MYRVKRGATRQPRSPVSQAGDLRNHLCPRVYLPERPPGLANRCRALLGAHYHLTEIGALHDLKLRLCRLC
jgi:hypothetical protein